MAISLTHRELLKVKCKKVKATFKALQDINKYERYKTLEPAMAELKSEFDRCSKMSLTFTNTEIWD